MYVLQETLTMWCCIILELPQYLRCKIRIFLLSKYAVTNVGNSFKLRNVSPSCQTMSGLGVTYFSILVYRSSLFNLLCIFKYFGTSINDKMLIVEMSIWYIKTDTVYVTRCGRRQNTVIFIYNYFYVAYIQFVQTFITVKVDKLFQQYIVLFSWQ